MSDAKPTPAGGRRQDRKVKNFLLDARFQLKFAGYFVAVTLVVAGLLGAYLVRTTDSLFSQMASSVEARKKAAETSRELGTCTLNNELTANLDDPEFASKLAEKSKSIDAAFEAESAAVQAASVALEEQQRLTVYALFGVLFLFIFLIAATAIVITHRIVGPLFRIKRMAREVAGGMVRPPTYGLRPSDELHDVFEVFADMVTQLRGRTEADLAGVKRALGGDAAALTQLEAELEARLKK